MAACAAPAPVPAPASGTPLASPLNSPLAAAATTIPRPNVTQDAALGSATGKLLIKGQPFAGRILYLAEIVKDANGNETAAGYDRANSPKATVLEDGSFTFANVKPGRYSIVLDIVRQAYMLKNPKDQSDLIIDVKAGAPTSFGTLDYSDLPQ